MSTLDGRRILVTRALAQASELAEALVLRGAVPILFPTIEIAPLADYSRLDAALANLAGYQWVIFTSVNGVAYFIERLAITGGGVPALAGRRLAAIGPATARALARHGLQVEQVPDEYVAEAIVEGLGDVEGQWILLPRAEIAREALADELGRRGALVHEVPVYRTLAAAPGPAALAELRRGVDVVTFTSASTVRSFAALLAEAKLSLDQALSGARVACIGPITAQAARDLGLPVHIQAEVYTMQGLVHALEQHLAEPATRS
jgi:uroporphyrinogen-III synthase